MRIILSGGSGFIGSALTVLLESRGHQVEKLVRDAKKEGIFWDPENGKLDPKKLEGADGIINLSGENITESRWNKEIKKKIRDSRVNATTTIVNAISNLSSPPKVLINTSAIGYYGYEDQTPATESTPAGTDFLASVCQDWENAAKPVVKHNVRLVLPRVGLVLSSKGGALAKMVPPFKMGMGGVIGSGKQFISWIVLEDLLEIFSEALTNEAYSGPINAVTPNSVTNKEFTDALGTVLNRPTIFPIPVFAAKMAFGEMAEALLLNGRKVVPQKLQEIGFKYQQTDIEAALQAEIKENN